MTKSYRINGDITEKKVKLVMEDGQMKGNIEIYDALDIAEGLGLDLVEVSPSKGTELAICKLIDYGKLKYKRNKHKKTHKEVMKEIRFHYNISEHDLEVKNKKVKEFLSKKYKVKYVLELRGREKYLGDKISEKMTSALNQFDGLAQWNEPSRNGRNLSVMLNPC